MESALQESWYRVEDMHRVMTPALLIYPDYVQANIDITIKALDGNVARWRPHLKTSKFDYVLRLLLARGIQHFKCATTLELLHACEAGARDVLLSYPLVIPAAERVKQIAAAFPASRVSTIIEDPSQIEQWRGSTIDLFIDVNPGMDRTGISQNKCDQILRLARSILEVGLIFRGLHYYEGHLRQINTQDRFSDASRGYRFLMEIVLLLHRDGIDLDEVVTSGTPTFQAAAAFPGFQSGPFHHRVSAGTVVYCDQITKEQLPGLSYLPAAVVATRVVSHPAPLRFTCDAGHKTLSVDSGIPNGSVIGHPTFKLCQPSEEHLPIDVAPPGAMPEVGTILYIVPRHVCPTVNNFDHALIVKENTIIQLEHVSARGRESPILPGL